MGRIWSLIWLVAGVGGVALMAVAYQEGQKSMGPDGKRLILFVAEEPEAKAENSTPVTVYFLPAQENVEKLVNSLGGINSSLGRSFLRNHQEKILFFPDFGQRFNEDMLASGRLPGPGTNEVLADPLVRDRQQIMAGDQELRVVGLLKKTASLGQDAYYTADDPALRETIDPNGNALISSFIISFADLKKIENIKKQFPREEFTMIAGGQRMDRVAHYNYVVGMFLFLLGGSGLLIQCYLFATRRITNVWLGPPLAEIGRHWRLFSLMHVIFFGLFLAGTLLIYDAPCCKISCLQY